MKIPCDLIVNLPSSCWIFMVEWLVDDTHNRLPCATEVNPDQNQSTVQTRRRQVTLLQHLFTALYILAGGILIKHNIQKLFAQSHIFKEWLNALCDLLPIGSIQMPSSEGPTGTVRPSVFALIVAGSWWMARARRDAAVWSPSSTVDNSAAVSCSVLQTVTTTLSPDASEQVNEHFTTVHTEQQKYMCSNHLIYWLLLPDYFEDESSVIKFRCRSFSQV